MLAAGLCAALVAHAISCPSEAGIQARLQRSTPAVVLDKHRWSVSAGKTALKLTLSDAGGTVVRERTVPAAASCEEREAVVAAVLAAWMMAPPVAQMPAPAAPSSAETAAVPPPARPVEMPTRRAVAAPLAIARDAPEVPAPVATVEAPVPAAAPIQSPTLDAVPSSRSAGVVSEEPREPSPIVLAVAETRPTPVAIVEAPPPRPLEAPEPTALRIEIAVDTRAQLAGSLSPGLGVTVSAGRRLAGFIEVSSALPRTLPLGSGTARWLRVAIGAGVRYRADLDWLYLEPAVSAEGAWVQVTGQGYALNGTASGGDVSACAQLRAGRQLLPAVGLYVGARGCAWPLPNRIGVIAVADTLPMPRFELTGLLGLGAGFDVKGSGGSRTQAP